MYKLISASGHNRTELNRTEPNPGGMTLAAGCETGHRAQCIFTLPRPALPRPRGWLFILDLNKLTS